MRPLMNLIGEYARSTEPESENRDVRAPPRVERETEQSKQERQCEQGDVSVGVEERAPERVVRIDMMQPERAAHALAD